MTAEELEIEVVFRKLKVGQLSERFLDHVFGTDDAEERVRRARALAPHLIKQLESLLELEEEPKGETT